MAANKARKSITFKEWIDETGVDRVAEKLKVTKRLVYYWRNGHCPPGVEQMKAIKKLSNDRVTYDAIIDGGLA